MRRSTRTAALCLSLVACAVLVGGFARTPAQKRATSGQPPLTEQLGALEIPREEYLSRLTSATAAIA